MQIRHWIIKGQAAVFEGIVERFHRAVLEKHFRAECRRTWFETAEEMQDVVGKCLPPTTPEEPI